MLNIAVTQYFCNLFYVYTTYSIFLASFKTLFCRLRNTFFTLLHQTLALWTFRNFMRKHVKHCSHTILL